jgi:hypothetical protein
MSEFLPNIKSKVGEISVEINPNTMRVERVSDGKNLGKIHSSTKGYYVMLEGKRAYLKSKDSRVLDAINNFEITDS